MDKWGPPKWKEIHVTSLYEDPAKLRSLLKTIDRDIPCPICKQHLRQYMKMHPIRADTDTIRWAINFHNNVNVRIGKRSVPYKEALELVSKQNTQSKACKSVLAGVLAGILVWNIV